MPKPLLPAAEYVRMSNLEQRYSFAIQREAIRQYAQAHGYEVTKSYEDTGKSGVALKGRRALKALLHDVLTHASSFKAILVYDVSRWGRFQDTDEAAHYEFLCKQAGVPVLYCAEQFTNEQSAQNAILKAVKRTMAGEYSRELSRRSTASHRRSAASGFRPGGPAGYGLLRVSVSNDGNVKRHLTPGERKAFATDRVTLVPGPKEEVARVRNIFRTYLQGKGRLKPGEIARRLNREGVLASHGGPWSSHTVLGVLTYPKYAGRLVWGRTSQRLRTKVRRQPGDLWVTHDGAFEPIISPQVFSRVQTLLRKNCGRRIPDGELIRAARLVFAKHGRIAESLMGRNNGTYSLCTIYRRFGSAKRLYELVGFDYPAATFSHGQETTRVRNEILGQILAKFDGRFTPFRLPNSGRRSNLLFDSKSPLYVSVALHVGGGLEKDRWVLRPVQRENDAPALLCLMRPGNKEYGSLYLFPALSLKRAVYTFGPEDSLLLQGVRLIGLTGLCPALKKMDGQSI